MRKKIGLLWTNPYNGNRGVGALTYSILHILEQIVEETNVFFEYHIMGHYNGPRVINTLNIGNKEVAIHMNRTIIPNDIKGKIKALVFRKDFQEMKKMDYVLDIGEGDSFSDIYGMPRFNKLNYTKVLYNKLGIKQMLLPQTIGPFKSDEALNAARKSMNGCRVVLPRDKQSYDYLRENKIGGTIDEIIDVAFFMPFTPQNIDKRYVNVGVNVSALLWYGGYTRDNQFNLRCDYKRFVKNIIDYFLSIPNVKIYLVPHVVDIRYDHVENDYAVSLDIEKEYSDERLVVSPFFLTPIQAKNFISSLDFLVGARMHATIAAFSSGVPVVPMAYSRKFNGLFNDTLGYEYMTDMVNQTESEMLEIIKEAFSKRTYLSTVIQNRMSTIVKSRELKLKQHLIDFLELK